MVNKKCCLVIFKPNNSWTLKIKFWRHLPFIFLISVFLDYGFVIWFWWVVNIHAQLPLLVTFLLLPPSSELWSSCLLSDNGIFMSGRHFPGNSGGKRASSRAQTLVVTSELTQEGGWRWKEGKRLFKLLFCIIQYPRHKSNQDTHTHTHR